MPTFAILGATGNVGRSLVEVLLQRKDVEIHALVRSRSKLLRSFPNLEADARMQVFEGGITDIDNLTACIESTSAVFLAVAATENMPGCTIAQDTAKAVLAALERLKQDSPRAQLPRLVILSSASLDDHLCRNLPKLLHSAMLMAASHIYADLAKAEKLLRAQEANGVKSVFIKPGGLVHDTQTGHELSTERQQTFLSYLDLAAGMVEVADCGDQRWDMKNVSVVPTGKDVKIEWWVPVFILKGFMYHFFPWLWPYFGS